MLQIHEPSGRSASAERATTHKSSSALPPTIVIQRIQDDTSTSSSSPDNLNQQQRQKRPSLAQVGRCHTNVTSTNLGSGKDTFEKEHIASIRTIENAVDSYLQVCALNNSFDLNKINEV